MDAEAAPLTTEDYQQLHGMLLSPDASVRAQGAGLAKKLTPDEQQAFFDVQKTANKGKGERTREDNSLLGMPPEFAVASGLPIARAVAGAGASLASKAAAAAGAAAPQAAAQAKYWGTKLALIKLGVNPTLAEGVAIAASGIKKGGPKGETPTGPSVQGVSVDDLRAAGVGENAINATVNGRTATAPSAAPASPVASAPAAPAPPAAVAAPPVASAPPPVAPSPRVASAPSPVAPSPVPQAPPPDVMQRLSPATEAAVSPPPPATMGPDGQLVGRPGGNPAMPDQKALNEAALAVRRAAYQARMSSAPPVEAPVAAAPAANVKLSAPETKAFLDLMKRGFSGPDAMKSVLQQRQLVEMLGSPTPTAAETRFPKGQRGKLMSQP